jgi:hypothetical protein
MTIDNLSVEKKFKLLMVILYRDHLVHPQAPQM